MYVYMYVCTSSTHVVLFVLAQALSLYGSRFLIIVLAAVPHSWRFLWLLDSKQFLFFFFWLCHSLWLTASFDRNFHYLLCSRVLYVLFVIRTIVRMRSGIYFVLASTQVISNSSHPKYTEWNEFSWRIAYKSRKLNSYYFTEQEWNEIEVF